jgi:predicted GNAT family acetyltransferase
MASRIESLDGPTALTHDDFLSAAAVLGGTHAGSGRNRVLAIAAPRPAVAPSRLVTLDRDRADDRTLIATFIDQCSAHDLDEAEVAIDELDVAIAAVLADDGTIASYASARPWAFDPDFDDIGVITHPQHRGQHLGAAAVSHLSQEQQRRGRMMFYNCNVDNVGSNRVAEAAGFEVVSTIAAASFD